MSTAAKNIRMEPGQRAVVLQNQMASNVLPWQDLCKRCGGELHVVPRPENYDWSAAVLRELNRLGKQVAVVALPNVHWTDGSHIDLELIGARCLELSIPLMVDLTQSA
eukprot:gene8228-9778_t